MATYFFVGLLYLVLLAHCGSGQRMDSMQKDNYPKSHCPWRYACRNHDKEMAMENLNCYCDELCHTYDDCCDENNMTSHSSSSVEVRPLPPEVIACHDMGQEYGDGEHQPCGSIYVVSRCPDVYKGDKDVRKRCNGRKSNSSDLFGLLPVNGRTSKILYRNIYCAVCNGEEDVLFWTGKVDFGVENLQIGRLPEMTLKEVRFIPFNGYPPRKCKEVIRHCGESWKGRHTREWCIGRAQSNAFVYSDRLVFRNKYCARCNYVNFTRPGCSYVRAFSSEFKPTPSPALSFQFNVDAMTRQTRIQLVDNEKREKCTITQQCDQGHMYDPLAGKCRRIVCREKEGCVGREREKRTKLGRCKPQNTMVGNVTSFAICQNKSSSLGQSFRVANRARRFICEALCEKTPSDHGRRFQNATSVANQYCRIRYSCTNGPSTLPDEASQNTAENRVPNCHCDEYCEVYDDCCNDYFTNRQPPKKLHHLSPEVIDCQTLGLRYRFGYFDPHVYVVGRCPEQFQDDYIREMCRLPAESNSSSTLFHVLPVNGRKSKILYRNYYCAVCNGEGDVVFWHAAVDVSFEEYESGIPMPLEKAQFSPPDGYNPRFCKKIIRQCSDNWNNRLIRERCSGRSQLNLYVGRSSNQGLNVYRNKYCAMCNFVRDSETLCFSYLPTLHGRDEKLRHLATQIYVDFALRNTTIVITSHRTAVGNQVAEIPALMKTHQCFRGHLYDPFVGKCQLLRCPRGLNLSKYGCTGNSTKADRQRDVICEQGTMYDPAAKVCRGINRS